MGTHSRYRIIFKFAIGLVFVFWVACKDVLPIVNENITTWCLVGIYKDQILPFYFLFFILSFLFLVIRSKCTLQMIEGKEEYAVIWPKYIRKLSRWVVILNMQFRLIFSWNMIILKEMRKRRKMPYVSQWERRVEWLSTCYNKKLNKRNSLNFKKAALNFVFMYYHIYPFFSLYLS